MTRALRLVFVATALTACSDPERLDPRPRPGVGTPVPTATSTGPADAGAGKRTVTVRSPFGTPTDNLFADGDYEMSTVSFPGSQIGWLGFSAGGGERLIKAETGGLCRTGLRCALMESGLVMFLRGASAAGSAMEMSVWAKPPEGRGCIAMSALVTQCDFEQSIIGLTYEQEPGADGWCEYRNAIEPQDTAVCLVLSNSLELGETMLVDSAVLLPAPEVKQFVRSAVAVSKETERMLAVLKDAVRRRTPFGKPAPKRPEPLR